MNKVKAGIVTLSFAIILGSLNTGVFGQASKKKEGRLIVLLKRMNISLFLLMSSLYAECNFVVF